MINLHYAEVHRVFANLQLKPAQTAGRGAMTVMGLADLLGSLRAFDSDFHQSKLQ